MVFTYKGDPREVCPIIPGHKGGREKVLTYQFAGSSSEDPVRGDWKCFELDQIKDAKIRSGPRRGGDEHRSRQRCVDDVFIEVNTKVLDQPGREPSLLKSLKRKRRKPSEQRLAKPVRQPPRRKR